MACVCSNYRPVTRSDRMLTFFGVEREKNEDPIDVWPTGLAPFIRLAQEGSGFKRIVHDGHFGLLPAFQRELAAGRKTYNARSETVGTKPTFRDAWRKGQRCIIPAEHLYEPCWETGHAVRWQIGLPMAVPMGLAGIWSEWTDANGIARLTFAMLTVNADGHPVMQRFHKPDEEKRMVIILDPRDYHDWLTCPVADAPRFFRRWEGPLETLARPLAPRQSPPAPPDEAQLF